MDSIPMHALAMNTFAIVEDHADLRNSWRLLIEDGTKNRCVGAFATAESALEALPALRPDLVLMDINLPGMSGIEATRILKELLPTLQILILTVYEEPEKIFAALEAGAAGYLLKRSPPDKLLEAVDNLRDGGSPMSNEVARMVVQSFRKPTRTPLAAQANLTPREEEILSLLAKGHSSKEISTKLFISIHTAHTHLKHIYEKLHVRSRTEAVLKYME